MTAPRQPRHRLADNLDIPAPAVPVEPPTEALRIIPSQRAAAPRVYPTSPRDRAPAGYPVPAVAVPSAVPGAQPDRDRRGMVPVVLAGVTALVLAFGVVVVVVESGGPAAGAPVSSR